MYTYTWDGKSKSSVHPVLFSNDDLYHSGLTDNILSISRPIMNSSGWTAG